MFMEILIVKNHPNRITFDDYGMTNFVQTTIDLTPACLMTMAEEITDNNMVRGKIPSELVIS